MVSGNVKKRDVQKRDEVLEIRIGQVSATNNQFDAIKVAVITKAVQPLDNLITYCKNLHNG